MEIFRIFQRLIDRNKNYYWKILANTTIQINIFHDFIVDEQFIKDIESMTIELCKPKNQLSVIYIVQTNIDKYLKKEMKIKVKVEKMSILIILL